MNNPLTGREKIRQQLEARIQEVEDLLLYFPAAEREAAWAKGFLKTMEDSVADNARSLLYDLIDCLGIDDGTGALTKVPGTGPNECG
jgi:hypothetical protein